eukprot:4644486-Pyramimonas_sp.AAC.1
MRAARFTSAFIGALEQLVADEGLVENLRGVSWFCLVDVHAVLRCDDCRLFPPRRRGRRSDGRAGACENLRCRAQDAGAAAS